MTSKPTHSTRLARLASKSSDLSYAQALDLVKRAQAEKRLPEILDADGMQDALKILARMKDEARSQATPHLARIFLGHGPNSAPFFIGADALSTHTMILGSTGSGRSVAFQNFISGMLDLGWSGTVLDVEGDASSGGLLEFCKNAASARTMSYQQVSAEVPSPSRLNALMGLGPDAASDLILSLVSVDDTYWHNVNKKLLTQLVNLCYDAFEATPTKACPTILDIGTFLEQPGLAKATAHLVESLLAARPDADLSHYAAVLNPDDDAQRSAVGLGAAITMLYDTQVAGRVLATSPANGAPEFNYDAPGLSYVGIDTVAHQDLARLVSGTVLAHASASARERLSQSPKPSPRFLAISGAGSVDYPHLAALLSKARAGAISVVFSDQSPLSFADDALEQLSQNVNVTVLMAQSYPVAAERAAALTGNATADDLRQLETGEAIVNVALPRPVTTHVTVSRAPAAAAQRTTAPGRLIAVVSPVGGSGRTTVSYLLAAALAKRVGPLNRRVCLVDADINGPGLAKLVDQYTPDVLHVVASLASVAPGTTKEVLSVLSQEALNRAIVHRPNLGFDLLLGPALPGKEIGVLSDPAFYTQVLHQLTLDYDYVIVDTPVAPTQEALVQGAILDQAYYTLVVTPLKITALLRVDEWLQTVPGTFGPLSQNFGLVINKSDEPSAITLEDAAREIARIPLISHIPFSTTWATANAPTLPGFGLEPAVVSGLAAIVERVSHS